MTTAAPPAIAEALQSGFRDVIETMFGLTITGPHPPADASNLATASIIGLAGPEFKGMLYIGATEAGARTLAAALLGGEEMLGDDPSMVEDSLGELANMLGGSVKRLIDTTGGNIELSLPSVVGGGGVVHGIGATGEAHIGWTVEGHQVQTSLVYGSR